MEEEYVEEENEVTGELTEEQRYQEATELFQCLNCMSACEDKIMICKKALGQYKKLGEYKDSKQQAKKCRELIAEVRKDQKEEVYQNALSQMQQAKTGDDYTYIAKKFRKLGDYKDASTLEAECRKKVKKMDVHRSRKIYLLAGVAVLIVLALFSLRLPFGKYYEAAAYSKLGAYGRAANVYKSLGSYRNSKTLYKQNKYQLGLGYKEKEDYSNALKTFRKIPTYKDCETLMVEMQKQVLAKKKVGSTTKIGEATWMVLKKETDRILLVKDSAVKNIPYASNGTSVSWENSNVRSWMNETYLKETFYETEIANMLETPEGTNSSDRLFLLSVEEVEEYVNTNEDASIKSKSNQWLRDTIADTGKAVFMNTDGVILKDGYEADSDQFSVRPAFWYSLK